MLRAATLVKTVLVEAIRPSEEDKIQFRIEVFSWSENEYSCQVWRYDTYRVQPTFQPPPDPADEEWIVLDLALDWRELRAESAEKLLDLVFDEIERRFGVKAKAPGSPLGSRTGEVAGEMVLRPVGVLSSTIKTRAEAPKQGEEGAPDAWLELYGWAADAMEGLVVGDEILVITWFHRAHRDRMRVHPRSDPKNPLTGVFATRSPDRPNPLGLHPVTVRAIEGRRLRVGPIEAIDGTPVVDIKPVL